ncbi:MAG: folate-binding protein YgfZ [Sulfuricella sp.]|nr:folate-binding protein YgfZ [Sulfuricella sp.]
MNSAWKNHLAAAGAVMENDCVTHFGDPAGELRAVAQGVLVDLSHLGLLAFDGEDSPTFLQGQTTNDVRQVGATRAQMGALCTHQGRMLANFLMWQRGGEYFMELPEALRAAVQKRLTMYVLRSKVKVRDAGAETVRLGVAGAAAGPALQALFGGVPDGDFAVIEADGATLMALPGGRYEIVAEVERAVALWAALRPACTPGGAACWEWVSVRAGVPMLLPPTQEQFTPQMANLELLGGVSFSKGCYTGQEVVARTQHLGKVKRRLYLAHIDGTAAPQPGDALAGTDHGMIVNVAPAPGGGFDMLAVIPVEDRAHAELRWKSADGPQLCFLDLPYPLS